MSQSSHAAVDLAFLATTLRKYSCRWMLPTAVIFALSALFVVVNQKPWEASQAMLIRAETGSNLERTGQFNSAGDMKVAQGTVLELVRSQGVIREALKEVGPPADYRDLAAWPTTKDIESARKSVQLRAPNGSEFGHTEVFYLKIRDLDPQRAIHLAKTLCDRMETRLQKLHDHKARSLVIELTKATKLAQDDHRQAIQRLSAIESEVGSDLADLRMLDEMGRGQSALRTTLSEIRNELRVANQNHFENSNLLVLLNSVQEDSNALVATPSSLLTSQPSLQRLKDGLVDAQLRTSQALGQQSREHPRVKTLLAAEAAISKQIRAELDLAIRSLQVNLKMSGHRVTALEKDLADVTSRMNRLVATRASYSNQVDEVAQLSEIAARSRAALADARTRQATAYATSLVTRLDGPVIGGQPIGPSRAIILIAGLFGGLATGLGILFLTVPAPKAPKVPSRRPAGAMTYPTFSEKAIINEDFAPVGSDTGYWH